jgi:hypothetical protein
MAERGRPSKYTPELAALICDRISRGESVRSICRDDDMPDESTVRQWAVEDREGFYPHYAKARDIALDLMADDIIEIADTPVTGVKTKTNEKGETETTEGDMIEHRRLRVDARKWYLSKLAPKRYGDKVAVGGAEDLPPIQTVSDPLELARGVAFLLQKGAHG